MHRTVIACAAAALLASAAASAQRPAIPGLPAIPEQLTALMPKFMRGEHLLTLAATKNCAWVSEAGVALPGFPGARN